MNIEDYKANELEERLSSKVNEWIESVQRGHLNSFDIRKVIQTATDKLVILTIFYTI